MRTVKKVEYIDGYRLKLLFDNNTIKVVDLTDVIKNGGQYFKPLQDIKLFKQVSLDDEEYPSSIKWPNDADLCPDVLYEMGKDFKPLKSRKATKSRATIRRHTSYAMSKRRKRSSRNA